MFSNNHRIITVILAVFLAAYKLSGGNYEIALLLFLFAGVQIWGYFRYGTVWLAFRNLNKGRKARAAKLIKQIRYPNLLSSQNRSYYELILGALSSDEKQFEIAEGHFRSALEYGPRTSNNIAIIELSLAESLIELNRLEEVPELLASARRRSHKATLDPVLNELEGKLRSSRELSMK